MVLPLRLRATSNHTMPAADLAKVDRISLMGGSTEDRDPASSVSPLGLTTWTKENRYSCDPLFHPLSGMSYLLTAK